METNQYPNSSVYAVFLFKSSEIIIYKFYFI
jgi:hypothetical protein